MKRSGLVHVTPALAVLALVILGLTAPRAHAADICPPGVGFCVVVNSNASTNVRDDVMTLPEALLIANGELPLADLTSEEQGQIVLMPPGWGPTVMTRWAQRSDSPPGFGGPGGIGGTSIYFDPDIFCDACQGNAIVLTPPGFGGPAESAARRSLCPRLVTTSGHQSVLAWAIVTAQRCRHGSSSTAASSMIPTRACQPSEMRRGSVA